MKRFMVLVVVGSLILTACQKSGQSLSDVPGNEEQKQSQDIQPEEKSLIEENKETEETSEKRFETETKFSYDQETGLYHGTLQLKGYVTTNEVDEPFCGDAYDTQEKCKKYTYASFHILKDQNEPNEALNQFISENEGNAYVGDFSIGIGCITKDGSLEYINDSDPYPWKSYTLDATDTAKMLASSDKNPVTIQLVRYDYSGGTEAPACYAHFADVKLVE